MQSKSHRIQELREKLAGRTGRSFWRGLEEIAETEEFRRWAEDEFPNRSALTDVDRRSFLKVMGASLMLAGLTGCRYIRQDKIVTYGRQPEDILLGRPLTFASAFSRHGYGEGVLVRSHEGRPTLVNGNPDHPANLGSSDIHIQASLLTLYDPDRAQMVKKDGYGSTWDLFFGELRAALADLPNGAGFAILSEVTTSPTFLRQIDELKRLYPALQWYQYDPVTRDEVYRGAQMVFSGRPFHSYYRFDRADVVVTLDADFLHQGPGHIRYTRDFMGRRRIEGEKVDLNRLYALECTPTLTGACADHRKRLTPDQLELVANSLAHRLGAGGQPYEVPGISPIFLEEMAKDLERSRGRSVVVPGEFAPATIHALAHQMNLQLGNFGQTVIATEMIERFERARIDELELLIQQMRQGRIRVLLILGGNPVYSMPFDLDFGEALRNVPLTAHYSLYEDETSALCTWRLPATHYLESWSDIRAFDGTASIVQPLIAPLYDGKGVHEVLASVMNRPAPGLEIVKDTWRQMRPSPTFERDWRSWLELGVIPGTQARTLDVSFAGRISSQFAEPSKELVVLFRPDPTIDDGAACNNGWLQECPKWLTKITWENTVQMSPATAEKLGLTGWVGTWATTEVVKVKIGDREIEGPLWILPGQPDGVITLHLGYGRTHAGKVGDGLGFDAYRLRTSRSPWMAQGAQVLPTGKRTKLATTQLHQTLPEDRNILSCVTVEQYLENPSKRFDQEIDFEPISMYDGKDHEWDGDKWGMTIDLNACTGCQACVVACQAENNIPVVGKNEVISGREMHWIRIDRYYEGGLDDPQAYLMPVTCMQCEQAPCEPVCPVAATVHSHEGLNAMVYNRCIGTRYCSNNCPYKVRRFNFLQYSTRNPQFRNKGDMRLLKMISNPDVTVRTRGVMEKCTFCVQRINDARIQAKKEGRGIRDGEIVTACEQACPAQAIRFGNIADPNSRVAKLKREPRNYSLFPELNTVNRLTYLGRVTNPNPVIAREKV